MNISFLRSSFSTRARPVPFSLPRRRHTTLHSSTPAPFSIPRRPRRLRRTAAIRSMVSETRLSTSDLVMPLFVVDGDGDPEAIDSLPWLYRFPMRHLVEECSSLVKLGIPGVALFPCVNSLLKDENGTYALKKDNLVLRAVRTLKSQFPHLTIITDIALDPYTSHGHDGIFNQAGDDIDNDRTIRILSEMAKLGAEAGVDFVAPSDMMDGRIGIIRRSLDEVGFTGVGIISYSAKYNSAYYGPFRDAVGSAQAAGTRLLNKATYQMNPANRNEAIIETELDEMEGADILMVKPAGPYLDIIREVKNKTKLPVAAYQVSGEYAQIHAAAEKGWLSLARTREESLLGIKRAGADIIFTYFAKDMAQWLGETL